jgi:hypothetical protein
MRGSKVSNLNSKDYVYDSLRSAFDEDKQLHSQNCLSWGKSVEQLKTMFKLDTLDPLMCNLVRK